MHLRRATGGLDCERDKTILSRMKASATVVVRWSWLFFCSAGVVPLAWAETFLGRLFPQPELEAVTVTDVTPAGRERGDASPSHPLYFAAISGGYRDFGAIKAGEKPLDRRVADDTVLKVLAKRGYFPAGPDRRPDLILAWHWGTFNTHYFLAPNGFTYRGYRRAKLNFLGGYKVGLPDTRDMAFPEQALASGLSFQSSDASLLQSIADDDLYVAVITAFAPQLTDGGRPVMLWRTRVSCPATGFWLPEAFPSMLAIAAPYIGRETEKPVRIRASERFRPEVNFGELQLVEYLKSQAAPPVVVQAGRSR